MIQAKIASQGRASSILQMHEFYLQQVAHHRRTHGLLCTNSNSQAWHMFGYSILRYSVGQNTLNDDDRFVSCMADSFWWQKSCATSFLPWHLATAHNQH